jgi:anti-sigma factor RsiW
MTSDERTLTSEEAIDQEIVAYLDGELDREEAARVERRLAEDPQYAARLNRLDKAWDMLDVLGRTEADDSFTQSTVAMVALKARSDSAEAEQQARRRKIFTWLALGTVALIAMVTTYAVVQNRLNAPNRELVRDLPIIERVDELRNIENVEFLQQLRDEGLFAAEVDDAL